MQCLCADLKSGKKNGCVEEECDHSFCTVQRQKKQTKCVDIPPKGLPWSTGRLKYLPGQRDLYTDLYLKDQVEQEAAKMQGLSASKKCKGKNGKKQNEADLNCLCFCASKNGSKKKKSRKSASRKSGSDAESQLTPNINSLNYGVEFEQVFVCDGLSSQPRKGYIMKLCKRPEADQAIAMASEAMKSEEEENCSNGSPADKGMICLCVPRAYLEQYRGPEEDICAKHGMNFDCPENGEKKAHSQSQGSIGSKKSDKRHSDESKPND